MGFGGLSVQLVRLPSWLLGSLVREAPMSDRPSLDRLWLQALLDKNDEVDLQSIYCRDPSALPTWLLRIGIFQKKVRLQKGRLVLHTEPVEKWQGEGDDFTPVVPEDAGAAETGIEDSTEKATTLSTANFVFQNFQGVVSHILQYCSVQDSVHVALTSPALVWTLEALAEREVKAYQAYHSGNKPSLQQQQELHRWSVLFGTVEEAAARLYAASSWESDSSTLYGGELTTLAGEARALCKIFPKVNRICFDSRQSVTPSLAVSFLAWTGVEETQALAARIRSSSQIGSPTEQDAWSFPHIIGTAAQEGQCLVLLRCVE
eukprot:jgi/Botrbrau1/3718/Bobra.0363s0005.1